jgi:hypothetical protein
MLKTVATFRDLPLAELAKSKLESEGVYCFLANKNHVAMNWLYSFALGGVKVQVKKDDFELAQKILGEDHSTLISEIENDFPPLEKNEFCNKCGSSDLEMIQFHRKAGAFSLLFGFPFVFFRKRYKCRDCGNKQK